jgi:hypothetical protein
MIDHVYFCDFPDFFAKAPGERKVNSFSVVAARNYGRKMLLSSFNYVVLAAGQVPKLAGLSHNLSRLMRETQAGFYCNFFYLLKTNENTKDSRDELTFTFIVICFNV